MQWKHHYKDHWRWRRWFAWYPVLASIKDGDSTKKYVWLEKVWRSRQGFGITAKAIFKIEKPRGDILRSVEGDKQ